MNRNNPVPAQGIGTQSLEEFLVKMEAKPQTLKWDALLVFDRAAANALLAQEYIDRIAIEEVFFPTLPDGLVDSDRGIEHVLLGLVLDKPRLSFENADIQHSKAKLQMRLVGGKHLEVFETYRDGEPVKSIGALSLYNASAGGLLDMDIDLLIVPGSVDGSGKVLIDLNKGGNPLFSGGTTGPERIRLGLYFKEVLKNWSENDERITKYPLSEIVVDDGSPINPGEFGIRTQKSNNNAVFGDASYGDGAVVMFVAMKGNEKGDYPADEAGLLYMLPVAAEPYTSNLVLSQKFMAKHVIKPGLDQFDWVKGKFDVEALAGERYKLVANDMVTSWIEFEYYDEGHGGTSQPWHWKISINGFFAQLLSANEELVFEDRSLKARWRPRSDLGVLVYWWQYGDSAGHKKNIAISAEADIDVSYKFVIVLQEGRPLLRFEMDEFEISTNVTIANDFDDGPAGSDARRESSKLEDQLKAKLASEFEVKARDLLDMTFDIDALRLNNLLFRGDNVVEPRDVSLPTDLTLLGNLAPKRTTMVISPSEPIVASGGVIEFSASSTGNAVTWTVENFPGETGERGEFKNPSQGRYTAPSDDDLRTEGQRRLIVTATSGELVSKALVSVVPSHVSVNPWVAAVNLGQSHALTAGTPDDADLTWDQPDLGSVEPDADPLNPGGYRYTAPTSLPKREPDQPNHFRVLRLDEVTVRATAGGTPATIDMLIVGAKNPNYWVQPEPRDDGSVALPFYKLDLDLNKVKVPEPIEWTVLRGSGTVDQETQVYTPGPDADEEYVIISAYHVNDYSADTHDYVILPLPFVPVRRYAEILSPTLKEV